MPSTIKRGGQNDIDAVKQWQGIIGVTQDGAFGPATESATKQWQTEHKLVADGVVGPDSWAAALGTKLPKNTQKTPQASVDNQAYEMAKTANPSMTEKERQYVLSVARGEGFYGRGWGHVDEKAASFGLRGDEGVGSNNWGAVQGAGSAGSFPHIDYHADGSPYVGNYKRYATPAEGFNDMARIILNGGKRGSIGASAIKSAINKGSLRNAVFAQHDNGYFELAPERYLAAVMKNYDILTVNNEWKKLLTETGGVLKKILGFVGLGILALAGVVFLKNRIT